MTGDPDKHIERLEALLGGTAESLPGTRPDLADAARDDSDLLASLAALAPPAEPPSGLFDAIEAEIDDASPITTLRAEEGEWIKRSDKIWKKILWADTASGRSIYLLRCEPGAVIASHEHARDEQALLLEGEAWVGDELLKAGDFQAASAGSIHPGVRTPGGCLLLVQA